ncbi:TIGR04211 family SH3 domain-containing protein [Thermodesulfobacteriota bacterium]
MAMNENRRFVRGRGSGGVILIILCILAPTAATATDLYVSDTSLEANLRTGAGGGHRIIAMLKAGTPVNFLREDNGWLEVELGDGKTGWILKRYMTERPPWRITAEKLVKKNAALEADLAREKEDHASIAVEHGQLREQLKVKTESLATLQEKYDVLRRGSAKYLDLKKAHESLISQSKQDKAMAKSLKEDNVELKFSRNVRWFLSGAGVLAFGLLVGMSMGGRRRSTPSFYR